MHKCPCGTNKEYLDCCGAFITGQKLPATPEELMRSRYTAYNQINMAYIANTMKSPAADNFDSLEAEAWAKRIIWTKLNVVRATHDSTKGVVEYYAYYQIDNQKEVLHEMSEFSFQSGKWYYVDGVQPNKNMIANVSKKIGRNDLCPCGSNKKFKKCCGNVT